MNRSGEKGTGVTHLHRPLLSKADPREPTGQQAGLGTQGSHGISRSDTERLWGSSCHAIREGE